MDVSNLPIDVKDALTTVARYDSTQPSKQLAKNAVPGQLPSAILGFVGSYIGTVDRAQKRLASSSADSESESEEDDPAITGEAVFTSSGSATTTGSATPAQSTASGQSTVDVSNLPENVKKALKAVTDYAIKMYNDKNSGSFTITDSALEKLHANILVFVQGKHKAATAAGGGAPTGTTGVTTTCGGGATGSAATPSTTISSYASVTPAQSATSGQRFAA
ncbi:hypothetical protein ACIS_00929 [Anaplasma centrale str. Israel]|uniref:Uncharacterized protein n=1 Tax=Anaplasma centrale (strain Israel) TaxID=574556 RepID=D1ASI6_ANACI|nr:hypothetical protein ACIS_00929 [Anaplasma centrale str. Israel]